MAYFPQSGSVVGFQSTSASLKTESSIIGTVPVVQSGTVISSISGVPQASVHGAVGASVICTVPVTQSGVVISSIVSTIPSSVIVGASIFGNVPVTQITNPWIITGSIQGGGGGIQYEENEADASVTGTAVMWKSNLSSSILSVVNPANPLPVSVQGVISINPASVSGTVGASVIGTVPVVQSGTVISSIVSTIPSSVIVGASIFGLAPVNVTNTNLNVGGSVVGFQGGAWTTSVVGNVGQTGTIITSISGTVVVASIVGTYAEDASHTTADPGIFTLGVRNDAVASFVGANLEYAPFGLDSAGRVLIKPFSADESRLAGNASIVSVGSVAVLVAAGTGLRNYATDILVSNTGSITALITFTDGDASVLGKTVAPATGGSNIVGMAMPMRTSANQPFNIVTDSISSVIHAAVYGYKAP